MARSHRKKTSSTIAHPAGGLTAASAAINTPGPAGREKQQLLIFSLLILAVGIYQSILYYGHQVVPTSDFPAFVDTGRRLLSFHLPGDYKRVPMLGIMQMGLSYLVGGQHPELTAGWLLNAILYPFNLLLVWLVGRRIIGEAAVWLALLVSVNPWNLAMLADPIAETTLSFFVLLSFYFIFRRSAWAYLFAAITTMVRYEGAALILAAFVLDMIDSPTRRRRLLAFLYAVPATLPLALWLLGTFLNWKQQSASYYLKEMGASPQGVFLLGPFLKMLWEASFAPLFISTAATTQLPGPFLPHLSMIIAAAAFILGCVYGLYKKRWAVLALLIFLVPYVGIHAWHGFLYPRFTTTISWIVLLLVIFGLQSLWRMLGGGGKIPRPLILALQAIAAVLALVWMVKLAGMIPQYSPYSPRSVSLPWVISAAVGLVFLVYLYAYRSQNILRNLAVVSLIFLMVVSSQFRIIAIVGDGQRDAEFKKLADWYLANAQPGEKIVTSMSHIARLYVPRKLQHVFVHTQNIGGDSPQQFIENCYRQNITYVAWDSRGGFTPPDNRYYQLWGLKNIAMLGQTRDVGPYEFLDQVRPDSKLYPRRYINIFRLRRPTAPAEPAAGTVDKSN